MNFEDQSFFSIWNHHKCYSGSFEYVWYGSKAIIIFFISVRRSTLHVRFWRVRRCIISLYQIYIWLQIIMGVLAGICMWWHLLILHPAQKECKFPIFILTNITELVDYNLIRIHITCHCKHEMNGVIGHRYAHVGFTGPGEPPEEGEINEMTLPSRHRTRNSSPGGLRPSTLPLGHRGSPQYWIFTSEGEGNILFLWNLKLEARAGFEPRSPTFQAGSFNHYTRVSALTSHWNIYFSYCAKLKSLHQAFKQVLTLRI